MSFFSLVHAMDYLFYQTKDLVISKYVIEPDPELVDNVLSQIQRNYDTKVIG
jgi:hypothetical protein